jgi:hypothetical protein
MGELAVDMFMSLGGVMQAPGEPDEDLEGGFRLGGWQVPYHNEEAGKLITEHMARPDALLMGRKTDEIFAAYWPQAPADHPLAALLNRLPKYVPGAPSTRSSGPTPGSSRATSPRRWPASSRSMTGFTPPAAAAWSRRCWVMTWWTS